MTHRFVGLEQRHQSQPKRVLHTRTPESIELTLEDAQGVADSLIAIPAEPDVEQIHTEGTLAIGDVQVDDVSATLAGHEPQRCRGEVAVRIDQDDASLAGACLASAGAGGTGQHEVMHEAEHERRLAAAGLGDRQEVPSQQTRR
jgi:hypothetical protein